MNRRRIAFLAIPVLLLAGWALVVKSRSSPPFAFLGGSQQVGGPEVINNLDRGWVRIRNYSIHASFGSFRKRADAELERAGWSHGYTSWDYDTIKDERTGKAVVMPTGVFDNGPGPGRWAVLLVYDGVKEASAVAPETSLPDWVDNNPRLGQVTRRAVTLEPGWCTQTLIESTEPSTLDKLITRFEGFFAKP